MSDFLKWGIHVMVSQNQSGQLTVGDSHEYGLAPDPFNKKYINDLILKYLQEFTSLNLPELIETWNGVYGKLTNGHTDLWTDWPDVCASVGNYLKEHGWNAGEPVLAEATVAPEKAADLDGRKLALSETLASLAAKGVSVDAAALPPEAPAILIAADEPDGIHWRVGYNNFFVITRYNHSALYAMAVYDLATAVKQRMLTNDAAELAKSATAATPP